MGSEKVVTAIITTYKRSPEIVKRAAQSVLNQSYKNIELIIVDDSPDTYELRKVVREMAISLGNNVRYIPHEKNMGACAARNTGLDNAKGEFVAFLDDDDEWLPEKIEEQLKVIEKNDNTALVYCGRYTYYAEKDIEELQKTKFHKGKVFDKLILENFIGSTSFPLIRKNIFKVLGGFDVNMPAAQDYEMWLRISKEFCVDYVRKPLVRYYVHTGEQITKNYGKKLDAYEKLMKKHINYLQQHKKAYSAFFMYSAYCCANYDVKKARKMFREAVKLYPVPTADMLRAFKWLYVMPLIKRR